METSRMRHSGALTVAVSARRETARRTDVESVGSSGSASAAKTSLTIVE